MPQELKQRAESGEAEAQFQWGQLVLHARQARNPEVEAFGWLEKAAAQGHSEAQYELGLMLLVGEGCEADPIEGVRRLELAAKAGQEGAAIFLERVYRHGLFGLAPNASRAAEWAEGGVWRRHLRGPRALRARADA
jgi:TPR repeat protein